MEARVFNNLLCYYTEKMSPGKSEEEVNRCS